MSGMANRMPLTARGAREKTSKGCVKVVESLGSGPAKASSNKAQSCTLRAIGPMVSSDQLSKSVSCKLMRPNVTFKPVRPLKALGMRTVLIHPLAGVLSAYGMGLADQSAIRQQSLEQPLDRAAVARIEALAWWDWPVERISRNLNLIGGGEMDELERAD